MKRDPLERAHPLDCECGDCAGAQARARVRAQWNKCLGVTVEGRRCRAQCYAPNTLCFQHSGKTCDVAECQTKVENFQPRCGVHAGVRYA